MKYYKIDFLLASIFIILFFTSCEVTEPTKGLEVRLNSKSRETLVSGYIYDSNILQPVVGNLTVTFSGNNSDKIIDATNENKTVFNVENGIFVFGVEDGTKFSSGSPFVISVIIKGENYNTMNETIELRKQGFITKNFYLINPDNLPPDSESGSFEAGETNASGELIEDVQYTTEGGITISMAGGTILENDNNAPVVGGLSSDVTVIPLTAGNQYNAPQSITSLDNEKITPILKFDFYISNQDENDVDNLSQDADFSIPVSDGLELIADRTISLWKKNNTTNQWYKVGEATVSTALFSRKELNNVTVASLNGNTTETGDLLFGNVEETCLATLEITNFPNNFNSAIQFFDKNGTLITSNNGSSIELEIPSEGLTIQSIRLNSELSDPFNTGVEIGSNVNLVCGTNTTTLNFPTTLVNVRLLIQGVCTTRDPVVVVNPNITFSYKKASASTWQSGSLVNGVAILSGLEQTVYQIDATYGERNGRTEFEIIDPNTIDITDFGNDEYVLSVEVDPTTEPTTISMEIDLGDECN